MSYFLWLYQGSHSLFVQTGTRSVDNHRRGYRHPFGAALNSIKAFPAMAANTHMSAAIVADQTMAATGVGPNGVQMRQIATLTLSPLQTREAHTPYPQQMESQSNLPTLVNWQKLEHWLEGYPEDDKKFLLMGYKNGFKIGHPGSCCTQDSPNLKTALEHKEFVSQKIASELNAGRLGGPFKFKPFPNFIVSPLGVVPKKNPGSYRMIHHLSYPRNSGCSENEHIPKELTSFAYAGIQDAISYIKKLGKGCYMSKTDVQSAFRIMPIHRSDYHLLGFSWEGEYYYDKAVPFGASSSCRLFEATSKALEWIAITKPCCMAVVHLLDDFLFLNSTMQGYMHDLNTFLTLCKDISVPIAVDKTVDACTSITFMGICLNSDQMQASLPDDKMLKCRELLQLYSRKDSCTLRELQSLLGYLNFCCSIITCGRAFLRRLTNLTIGIQKPFHHIRLNREVKSDLCVWLSFLDQYNGKSMFLNEDSCLAWHWLYILTVPNQSGMAPFTVQSGSMVCFHLHGTRLP